tara:strand:+ start:277 stop:582 length:306 start_codon:yes stop_codon:yes gene_type:complete
MYIDGILVWLSTLVVIIGITPFVFEEQMRKFPNHIPMMMIFCALMFGHMAIWVIYVGPDAYMCDPEVPERAVYPGTANLTYFRLCDRSIAQVSLYEMLLVV